MATTIIGPMDILNQAGRLWNRVSNTPATPYFDVAIASVDGQPIKATNRVLIQPHISIAEVDQTDLIVIASATYIERILEKNPELVSWIRRHYEQGAHVASICTGVFLLAETGLLDGKAATLHWGFTQIFREKYPQVQLRQDRMYLDQGRLLLGRCECRPGSVTLFGGKVLRAANRRPMRKDHDPGSGT